MSGPGAPRRPFNINGIDRFKTYITLTLHELPTPNRHLSNILDGGLMRTVGATPKPEPLNIRNGNMKNRERTPLQITRRIIIRMLFSLPFSGVHFARTWISFAFSPALEKVSGIGRNPRPYFWLFVAQPRGRKQMRYRSSQHQIPEIPTTAWANSWPEALSG